jgi:hypothetical protein
MEMFSTSIVIQFKILVETCILSGCSYIQSLWRYLKLSLTLNRLEPFIQRRLFYLILKYRAKLKRSCGPSCPFTEFCTTTVRRKTVKTLLSYLSSAVYSVKLSSLFLQSNYQSTARDELLSFIIKLLHLNRNILQRIGTCKKLF